jgi:uncharacterized protein
MCAEGRGVPRDADEAVRWYHQAVAQGYAPGEFKLGLLYYDGTIVARDFPEALRWLHKAAEHGSAPAQNQIGYAYEHGEGVPQSLVEAGKWYRMAAQQGLGEAQRNLAVLRTQNASASANTPAIGGTSLAEGHAAGVVPNVGRVP